MKQYNIDIIRIDLHDYKDSCECENCGAYRLGMFINQITYNVLVESMIKNELLNETISNKEL